MSKKNSTLAHTAATVFRAAACRKSCTLLRLPIVAETFKLYADITLVVLPVIPVTIRLPFSGHAFLSLARSFDQLHASSPWNVRSYDEPLISQSWLAGSLDRCEDTLSLWHGRKSYKVFKSKSSLSIAGWLLEHMFKQILRNEQPCNLRGLQSISSPAKPNPTSTHRQLPQCLSCVKCLSWFLLCLLWPWALFIPHWTWVLGQRGSRRLRFRFSSCNFWFPPASAAWSWVPYLIALWIFSFFGAAGAARTARTALLRARTAPLAAFSPLAPVFSSVAGASRPRSPGFSSRYGPWPQHDDTPWHCLSLCAWIGLWRLWLKCRWREQHWSRPVTGAGIKEIIPWPLLQHLSSSGEGRFSSRVVLCDLGDASMENRQCLPWYHATSCRPPFFCSTFPNGLSVPLLHLGHFQALLLVQDLGPTANGIFLIWQAVSLPDGIFGGGVANVADLDGFSLDGGGDGRIPMFKKPDSMRSAWWPSWGP